MEKMSLNKVFFWMLFPVWVVLVLWNFATPDKGFSQNENRVLAEMPEFSVEDLLDGDYARGIDTYVSDQFVFRDGWIAIKTVAEKALLKTDGNNVFYGKDGYLIEKHDDAAVNPEIAQGNLDNLKCFIDLSVGKLGIDRVNVMFVPTASEVLKDKLPLFATGYDQTAYNNLAKDTLPEGTYLDVKDTLINHKDEYIYYRTDHHWTTLGAYYAYVEWAKDAGFTPLSQEEFDIELASDEFLGTLHSKVNLKMKPDEMYLYKIKKDMDFKVTINLVEETDSLYDYTALEGKDKYSVYMSGNNSLVEVKTNNTNGRKLLVIKDSYSHCFVPFALNHFEETHLVDFRYYNSSIKEYMEQEGITDVLVLYNTMNFVKERSTIWFTK